MVRSEDGGCAGNNPASYSDPFGLCPPKTYDEIFQCTGKILQPWEAPLQIGGTLATLPVLASGDGPVLALGLAAKAAPKARVIGHFPAYLQVAEAIGAKVFNLGRDAFEALSEAAQWSANKAFLDDAIKEGAEIVMATRKADIRSGSILEREVGYLLDNGYKWAKDGKSLVPK